MGSAFGSLWPEGLDSEDRLTPRTFLQYQASLLSDESGGRLTAEVRTRILGRDFAHSLEVVAPALDNYRHLLVRVRHGVEQFYPLRLMLTDKDEDGHYCDTEAKFVNAVAAHVKSERTASLLRALAVQCGTAFQSSAAAGTAGTTTAAPPLPPLP